MIYLIKTEYKTTTLLKIGYAECIEDRIKTYKTHNPLVELLDTREGDYDLETYLHKYFKKFSYSNQPEWFYYNEKIIKEFKYVEDKPFIEDVTSKVKSVFFTAPSFSKFREKYIEKYGEDEFNKCDNFIFNYWLDYSRRMNGIELEVSGDIEQITWDSKIYVSNLPFDTPDIEIEISSLFGRQRNKSNQFKNNVTIFYKLLKDENLEDRCAFDKLQDERKRESQVVLDIYDKCSSDAEKLSYVTSINARIYQYQYEKDFISISKASNLPTYNNLIEVANERAWEVSQKDYQDSINVARALEALNIVNITKEYRGDVDNQVFKVFPVGNKYTLKYIKEQLELIYTDFKLAKTPKATDLEQWFEIKSIQWRENGKKINGFEIVKKK